MVDFKNLKVWHRAIDLAIVVYEVIKGFPKEERYALTDQLRRASVSVFSNIAEGCRSGTDGELIYFLGKARGSCAEAEAQLIFAGRVGLVDESRVTKLTGECEEVSRMISGYIKYLKEKK
ncbi:MAG: four helix bundle protein [Nanoarchaeota archaeon]|nr:four helix bundle protein [Nanoarchaeota archaeon]